MIYLKDVENDFYTRKKPLALILGGAEISRKSFILILFYFLTLLYKKDSALFTLVLKEHFSNLEISHFDYNFEQNTVTSIEVTVKACTYRYAFFAYTTIRIMKCFIESFNINAATIGIKIRVEK
ncbi:MAG: hypothetical protein ACRCV3_03940 [Desulfovibrionaceae bacterium]